MYGFEVSAGEVAAFEEGGSVLADLVKAENCEKDAKMLFDTFIFIWSVFNLLFEEDETEIHKVRFGHC